MSNEHRQKHVMSSSEGRRVRGTGLQEQPIAWSRQSLPTHKGGRAFLWLVSY